MVRGGERATLADRLARLRALLASLGDRYPVLLARQVVRRCSADRIAQQASALAFQSALGLVPLLAVAFALLKAARAFDARSALLEFFARGLFPSNGAEVVARLGAFADHIDVGALGAGGLGATLLVVYLLFHNIEALWNRIWLEPRTRSLWSKFVVFYTLATLVPFLVGVSLYHTARYWRGGPISYVTPLAATWVALFLGNKLLPVARVRWRAAALGAPFSAVLFEAAKQAVGLYVAELALSRYHNIYGALGLVPLLLLWIYVGWLTVLVGAELAHAFERLGQLPRNERREASDLGADPWAAVSGHLAARLLVDLARHFATGGRALGDEQLAARHGLDPQAAARVLERLRERGIVIAVDGDVAGWLLARPAEQIPVAEVIGLFRSPELPDADALDRLWADLERAGRERLGATTIRDLV